MRRITDFGTAAERKGYTYRVAYENYVGRVGGLAVALGIGAALATGWSCPAWADGTAGSAGPSSPGASSSDTVSGSAETQTDPKPGGGAESNDVAAEGDSQSAGDGTGGGIDNQGADGGNDEPTPDVTTEPESVTDSPATDTSTGHRSFTRAAAVVESDLQGKAEVDASPEVEAAGPAEPEAEPTGVAVPPVAETATVPQAVTAAAFVAAAPAAPEETATIIAAVTELADTDLTRSTPGPAAPLQAATVVAALAAVRDELEQTSMLRAASLVSVDEVPALVDDTPNVLVIGVDGTNLSRILANLANANFFGLIQQSTTAAARRPA